MGNLFNTHLILEKMQAVKTDLPLLLANQAQRFFKRSFDEHGWEDQGFEPWAPRAKVDSQRAILVKSGALRRAVGMSAKTITFQKIQFVVPLAYAAIHNYGGHSGRGAGFEMTKREFMGDSAALRTKQLDLITKTIDKIWTR